MLFNAFFRKATGGKDSGDNTNGVNQPESPYPQDPGYPEEPGDSTVSLGDNPPGEKVSPVDEGNYGFGSGLQSSLPSQPRCYAACIRMEENGVPYYCIIPVRDGFSRKNADARAALRSCVFYADRRNVSGGGERVPRIQELEKKLSIPMTLYLAPIPKKEGVYKDELLVYSNGDNVSFSVSFESSQGDFYKSGLTEFRIDPDNLYNLTIEDKTNYESTSYSFEITFCKDINGFDYNIISAFMPE